MFVKLVPLWFHDAGPDPKLTVWQYEFWIDPAPVSGEDVCEAQVPLYVQLTVEVYVYVPIAWLPIAQNAFSCGENP